KGSRLAGLLIARHQRFPEILPRFLLFLDLDAQPADGLFAQRLMSGVETLPGHGNESAPLAEQPGRLDGEVVLARHHHPFEDDLPSALSRGSRQHLESLDTQVGMSRLQRFAAERGAIQAKLLQRLESSHSHGLYRVNETLHEDGKRGLTKARIAMRQVD